MRPDSGSVEESEAQIAPGTVFQERYEILAKVGEGGFGQVYRARQRVTGQEVAVKVLRRLQSRDESHTARFQRELRLCAQLYHPNIVRLIDSGRAEQSLYTVFEFVPGRTLSELLAAEGALPPWEATHLMMQVLDALGCAHNRGVVHRDLKPQNIMVTATGVRRNALVLDFGLGTLTEETDPDVARITRTREVLGTPAYAAPEQLRGEAVSARADLYSWALIFLECLTGRRVVEGATLQEVLFKQLGPEPVALPEWLQGHWLGRVLRRVVVKDAESREVTAQSLLRELETSVQEGWPQPPARTGPGTPASQLPTLTEGEVAGGERRQLTAVCCGFSLSTTGPDEPDVEDLDRVLREQHEACVEVARRHDGQVGGVLGERVLFFFGYPQAREDDARRAARAALEVVAQARRAAAALERGPGLRLETRVGLHTGIVVSQERRNRLAGLPALAGTTPRVAAGLEALAEPGTILVSEAAERLLRDVFPLEPAGAHALGASALPVDVFRLREGARAANPARPPIGPDAGLLYGRARELELLHQRWLQARQGSGQVILVSGEAGIGKSRLARELARRVAGTAHTFLEARCAPESRHSVLRPVVELLEQLLGPGRDGTPEQTARALEELLGRHGLAPSEAMPLLAPLLHLPPQEKYPAPAVSAQRLKELTLEAVLTLLCELAERQPLLLLVEDLHWADPTTLELLTKLVEDAPTTRLCALLTARPEFHAPWSGAQVLPVQLGRLERERAEEMVRGLTRERPLPREVVEQVVARTDGVPLFVEELTRMVAEALFPLPGRADTPTRSQVARLAIPATLRDSLMARLDRLGPARETAQLAAALGREFSYELLKLLSSRGEAALQQDLAALVDADLVYRRRSLRNPAYIFKHALVRDTAYGSMLRLGRKQVHARIAAALEQHFPERVRERPDLLALHHAAAEQKRAALEYARQAALAALMRSANTEALAHATEALEWLESVEDPRERAQVELELNGLIIPALMATRGWSDEQIRERVERSQALLDTLGDGPRTAPTLWALMNFHHTRGHRARARALAERLVAMAELAGDVDGLVPALPALAQCLCTEGKLTQARALVERALPLYDEERHRGHIFQYGLDSRAWSEMTLAFSLWFLGYPEQAMTLARSTLKWAQQLQHRTTVVLASWYLALQHQQRGEVSELLFLSEASLHEAEEVGMPFFETYFRIQRAWARGDVDELHRQLGAVESYGLGLSRSYHEALVMDAEVARGQYAAALGRVDGVLRRAGELGELFYVPELLRLKGTCLYRGKGDVEGAEACFRNALVSAREQDSRILELRAAVALATLLHAHGRSSEGREALAPVLARFTEGQELADLVRAHALLRELGSA
ncbi:TOMM system kinase/cyclase fusion protein [Myxococcaceae bacterium GXIMD 01537]